MAGGAGGDIGSHKAAYDSYVAETQGRAEAPMPMDQWYWRMVVQQLTTSLDPLAAQAKDIRAAASGESGVEPPDAAEGRGRTLLRSRSRGRRSS
eukprot:11258967-Alexandrium_andersonii.AAC.1